MQYILSQEEYDEMISKIESLETKINELNEMLIDQLNTVLDSSGAPEKKESEAKPNEASGRMIRQGAVLGATWVEVPESTKDDEETYRTFCHYDATNQSNKIKEKADISFKGAEVNIPGGLVCSECGAIWLYDYTASMASLVITVNLEKIGAYYFAPDRYFHLPCVHPDYIELAKQSQSPIQGEMFPQGSFALRKAA